MSTEGINALSLFDGMSCFQIALDSLNINVANYYASEIDKHAIKVTIANYPNTIQLGSVLDIDTSTLPRIEILCGGSPCQSFSFAGKRKGMSTKCSEEVYTLERYLELKADGYAFEGQSYLFWEYMRVLTELIVAKNRGGATGTAPMRFHAPTTSFSPWDDMPQARSLPFAAPINMDSVRSPMPKSDQFDLGESPF